MKFDPHKREDVSWFLMMVEACPPGRRWFDESGPSPARIWAETEQAPFMIWLLQQLLRPEELSWRTPGTFVVRLMALCKELLPWLSENCVEFGSDVDWENLPEGIDSVVADFVDRGLLYEIPRDVTRTAEYMGYNLTEEYVYKKFADLVRELYPYEAIKDLMVRWVEENVGN